MPPCRRIASRIAARSADSRSPSIWKAAVWISLSSPGSLKAPRFDCPHCRGRRFVYLEEQFDEIKAAVVSRNPRRSSRQVGEFDDGTVQITVKRPIVPGLGDLFLPLGEVHVVAEQIVRGGGVQVSGFSAGDYYHDNKPPPELAPPGDDWLLYPDPVAVDSVIWTDVLPDGRVGPLRIGQAGLDFNATDQGRVRWVAGRGPAVGSTFTIRYRAKAAYMARPGRPVYRADHGRSFPYRVEAQRMDRWGREDARDNVVR